jgi:hypothetical protein
VKRLIAAACIAASVGILGGIAAADQPGPGDKQCVPGQQGNPHPGHKAGVC